MKMNIKIYSFDDMTHGKSLLLFLVYLLCETKRLGWPPELGTTLPEDYDLKGLPYLHQIQR